MSYLNNAVYLCFAVAIIALPFAGIPGVSPVSDYVAEHIEAYVKHYGETLIELPEETWKSSVCIWTGHHWDAINRRWFQLRHPHGVCALIHAPDVVGGEDSR